MSQYKLIYFDARGAGELSRLLFKVAGKDFVDERVKDWPKIKEDMPLKALPVLEIGGEKICQSHAIARFLAREFGLMGADNRAQLRIEELEDTLAEMFQKEVFKIFGEKDDAKKKEIAVAFEKGSLQTYLDFAEKKLKLNKDGKGFFIGDKLTYADILMYDGFFMLKTILGKMGMDPLKNRELLQAHSNRVEAVPNIAAWIKARPKTEF